jgi:hypothetical protein
MSSKIVSAAIVLSLFTVFGLIGCSSKTNGAERSTSSDVIETQDLQEVEGETTGTGAETSDAVPAPSEFKNASLSSGDSPKYIKLSWVLTGPVHHFQIELKENDQSDFEAVDLNRDGVVDDKDFLSSTTTEVGYHLPIHRVNFNTAAFRITALDREGKVAAQSKHLPLSKLSASELIGYFKAPNTDKADVYGESVAISDRADTLAVGAPGEDSSAEGVGGQRNDDKADDSGAVYVFGKKDSGAWSLQAYVKATNTNADDDFGEVVTLSGDGSTLAVGASDEDSSATGVANEQYDNEASSSGAVYVYQRTKRRNWYPEAYIKASNTDESDSFGSAISISSEGDTLVIGAPGEDSRGNEIVVDDDNNVQEGFDNSASGAGAVYMFRRSPEEGWSQQAYFKAFNAEEGDLFGSSVAISDEAQTIAVGARDEDSGGSGSGADPEDNNLEDAGAVYLFESHEREGWSQQAYLKASDPEEDAAFGDALSLSGNGRLVAVGAPDASGDGGEQSDKTIEEAGAAYVFKNEAGEGWSQVASLKPSNPEAFTSFGKAIALSGRDRSLAIGAPLEHGGAQDNESGEDDSNAENSGAVYLYEPGDDQTWRQRAHLKAPNVDSGDGFGTSVVLSDHGNTLVIGTDDEDSSATGIGGEQDNDETLRSGAVYLF